MKTFLGGVAEFVVGVILLIFVWFEDFLQVLAGIVPVMLLLSGLLAAYLGYDELKDSSKKEEAFEPVASTEENVDKFKQEIDDLKEEIETLKKEKDGEEEKEDKEDKAQKEEK